MPSKSKFDQVLDQHRLRLTRLTERSGVARIKKLYAEATSDMTRKLAATAKRIGGKSFTMHAQRAIMAQLTQGQILISSKMAGELNVQAREAQEESLRALSSNIKTLEKHYTDSVPPLAIDEAAIFAGVVDKRKESLLKQHKTSMANYGARVIGQVENQLALSTLEGESPFEAVGRVQDVIEGEWWQAERIVRTETAYAVNATHSDGIEELVEELPDIMCMWCEHCDEDGNPLDDRVAVDSQALHRQVVMPGGWFTEPDEAPDGQEVPDDLAGDAWQFPPNRPNDRAVITAWRQHWGGVAWRYSGGERIFLSE